MRDNEASITDLEPTVETKNALLKLKTSLDTDGLRRQVREATRQDIGARLQAGRAQQCRSGPGPEAYVRVDLGCVEV